MLMLQKTNFTSVRFSERFHRDENYERVFNESNMICNIQFSFLQSQLCVIHFIVMMNYSEMSSKITFDVFKS